MRNAFKHTGVLMMTAVIGLSIIGAAYALWFEDLKLTANVTTGTFNIDWSCEDATGLADEPTCEDSAVAIVSLDQGDSYTTDIPEGKAPDCTAAISDLAELANDEGDNNSMTISLGNLYPFAGCRFAIDIHNEGSVPAHVQIAGVSLECTDNDGPCYDTPEETLAAAAALFDSNAVSASWEGTCEDGNGPDAPGDTATCWGDLSAQDACQALVNPIPAQLPGQVIDGIQLHNSNELHCYFDLTLNQVAEAEGQSWVAMLTLRWKQWNEDNADPS